MTNRQFTQAKRLIYALIAAALLVTFLFSILSFDQTLAANGKISADEKLIFMQAHHTATIKKIFVKRGEYVKKDQALLLLDNTLNFLQTNKMTAELAIINNKLQQLKEKIAFLKYQTLNQARDLSHLQTLKLHISDSEQAIVALQQEQSLQTMHLQLISAQIKDTKKLNQMHEKLYQKRYVSLHQLLTSRQKLRLDQMQLIAEKMAYQKLSNQIAEKVAQLKEFKSEQLTEINQKIVELQQQQQQLQNNIAAICYESTQATLPAPISGYILAITELAPGSSIASGQTYIQIAPLAALQYAEVYLTSDQIGWLKLNQQAIVTLNALSTQQHVDLAAIVTNIAPHPIKLKNNDYYLVQVKLSETQLKKIPANFHLQAGMQARVYFKIGKTRLINYFIYPLWQQIKEL